MTAEEAEQGTSPSSHWVLRKTYRHIENNQVPNTLFFFASPLLRAVVALGTTCGCSSAHHEISHAWALSDHLSPC